MTECGGTDGEFLSSCKLQESLPATTLLLFGVVTLLCGFKFGTFLFYLLMKDLFICQTEHHHTVTFLSRAAGLQAGYTGCCAALLLCITSHFSLWRL